MTQAKHPKHCLVTGIAWVWVATGGVLLNRVPRFSDGNMRPFEKEREDLSGNSGERKLVKFRGLETALGKQRWQH